MGHGTEAAGSGDTMAVPLTQHMFDEAVAANGRSGAAGPGGSGLEQDAAVAAWRAITRHEVFGSAPPLFRAFVFHMLGLALHLRSVAGGAPADIDASITAFETAVATIPTVPPRGRPTSVTSDMPMLTRLSRVRPPIAMRHSRRSRRRSKAPRWTLQSGRDFSRTSALVWGVASDPVGCRRISSGRSGPSRAAQ